MGCASGVPAGAARPFGVEVDHFRAVARVLGRVHHPSEEPPDRFVGHGGRFEVAHCERGRHVGRQVRQEDGARVRRATRGRRRLAQGWLSPDIFGLFSVPRRRMFSVAFPRI